MSSLKRIAAAVVAIVCLTICVALFVWGPVGVRVTDGRHDLGRNGMWIGHGWLGDDAWFGAKRAAERARFRDPERLRELAGRLRAHHLTDVFPHLCPAEASGELPGVDAAQVERFLDHFTSPTFRVMPWVGGHRHKTARVQDAAWRARFAAASARLVTRFPRLAGVHVNVEPCASGSADLLALLDGVRGALPAGKLLSISAYPPPLPSEAPDQVHWDEAYVRAVARRVDQIAFMMYDSSAQHPWSYQRQVRRWTGQVLAWSAPAAVLLGVPAYEDEWAVYHRPEVENLDNGLAGVHAGLSDPLPAAYQGIAVYCEWEMNDAKWRTLREEFVRAR